jgi:hypothetical protein
MPLLPAVLVILAGLALLTLYFFNPQQHGFYPFCMFYRTTGLLCPGCGSLRALHELLHGQLFSALRLNPLLVASIPLAVILAWRRFGKRSAPPVISGVPPLGIWICLGLLIVFGIIRNLPFFKELMAGI